MREQDLTALIRNAGHRLWHDPILSARVHLYATATDGRRSCLNRYRQLDRRAETVHIRRRNGLAEIMTPRSARNARSSPQPASAPATPTKEVHSPRSAQPTRFKHYSPKGGVLA